MAGKRKAALTPEGREDQMINYAIDLAEQQLRDGTASSQVITHYLKLGSVRERQEREMQREQIKLLRAKTEALESARTTEEFYGRVLASLRSYRGEEDYDEESEED